MVVRGGPHDFPHGPVYQRYAVIEHGHGGFASKFASGVKPGAVENDVIGVPHAGRPRGIHQGRILAVDGGSFAIGIGHVIVKESRTLNFIEPVEKDAAVATVLVRAMKEVDWAWSIPRAIGNRRKRL